MIINFLTVLAWVLIVISAFMLVMRFWGCYRYSNSPLAQSLDLIRGVKRKFPVVLWFWILVVAIVFLVAKKMS